MPARMLFMFPPFGVEKKIILSGKVHLKGVYAFFPFALSL
jgi:hypothetical protein